MSRYLHRLLERASATAAPPITTRAHIAHDDPFEHAIEERATPSATRSLPEPAAPSSVVTRVEREPVVIRETSPIVHAEPTSPQPVPAIERVIESPAPQATIEPAVQPVEPPQRVERVTESSFHEVRTHELRIPGTHEHTTTKEKWLSPEPPRMTPPVPPPAAAPNVAVAPVLQPPVLPPAALAAPAAEPRPSLSIGRVVVEVRPPAPPPPPPVAAPVRAAAPTSAAPIPSVVRRNFGLGQS